MRGGIFCWGMLAFLAFGWRVQVGLVFWRLGREDEGVGSNAPDVDYVSVMGEGVEFVAEDGDSALILA